MNFNFGENNNMDVENPYEVGEEAKINKNIFN